jgi:biotin carboxylase
VDVEKTTTFEQMERAAFYLCGLVGYVSPGTVECVCAFCLFLFAQRLHFQQIYTVILRTISTSSILIHDFKSNIPQQMVTGVNFPAAQFQIAMGMLLHGIRDVRQLYGVDWIVTSEIDFDMTHPDSNQLQPFVLKAMLSQFAENPDARFKLSSGSI